MRLDDNRAVSAKRWVPPSYVRRNALYNETYKKDITFRKVRGILNKLTPDKFTKLSDDLLKLDLGSRDILKGVILLIFDKALDEPKYSSMYAQLCKRLCDEAPSFETQKEPCTFKILLLASCRMQFESRPKNERDKRKSLGNIKFIGELCKLAVLSECILHKCMLLLLKKCDIDEQAENLECLCQILRTCGRILDHEKGKFLMDQYFERMEQLKENTELPSRIRFMIQDSIELRGNKWVPRKATKVEGPLPIAQVGGGGSEQPARERPPPQQDLFPKLKTRTGLDAMLANSNNGMPYAQDKYSSSYTSNGFSSGRNQSLKTTASLLYNQPSQQSLGSHYGSGGRYSRETNGKEAPRFKRMTHDQLTTNPDEVSLRPPSNSIIAKSYNSSNNQNSSNSLYKNSSSGLLNDSKPSPPIQTTKEVPLVIKPTATEKAKPTKKEKATTKEETMKKVNSIAEEVISGGKLDEAVTTFSQLKIQDKLITESVVQLVSCTFDKNESDTETMMELVGSLRSDGCVASERLAEAARDVVRATSDTPRCPAVAALTVRHQLLSLDSLAELAEPHFPLLFDALAKLHVLSGKDQLTKIFSDSKVRLMHCLPEAGRRRKEALRAVLEERGLVYLEPVLGLEAELWAALERDPSPQSLYRQAKECLAQAAPAPHFVTAIVTVVIRFVNQEVVKEGGDSKAVQDREKVVLERFKAVLQAFLQESVALQVEAVYALQMFYYHLDFPKGTLLRWFVYFYDLEIVEEEAFLKWREDEVTDQYPGKGEALFQVNQWLNWLSTAEEEDEEEDAD